MAVAVGERTLGCGTHVREDERGCGFAGETFEIDAVPGGDGGSEDTGFWA